MRHLGVNATNDDVIRAIQDLARDLDTVRSGRFKIGADIDMRGYGIKGMRKPVDANDAQTKIGDIAGQFAPLASKYVVASNLDPLLPNERLLAGSSSITITDNGGGSTIAISATQAFFDALYQPLNSRLTTLATQSFTGKTLNLVRVNAGETDYELVAPGSISAGTITVADAGGDTTTFPALFSDATGTLAPLTDAGLTYNATTNALTTTTFIGALTGTASSASNGVLTAAGADPSMYVCLFNSGSGTRPFEVSNNIQFDNSTGALKVTTLGDATTGIGSLYLDDSGSAFTSRFISGALGANITLTGPTSTGTLALTSDIPAVDAFLTSIAALGTAADRMIYTTGVDTAAELTTTAFGRGLLGETDASTTRTTLGLVIGTNVQAYDADLTTWAGITPAAGVGSFLATALGATTEILVGGGAGVAPVWTTATGTGAPMRAGSPTTTGTLTAAAANFSSTVTVATAQSFQLPGTVLQNSIKSTNTSGSTSVGTFGGNGIQFLANVLGATNQTYQLDTRNFGPVEANGVALLNWGSLYLRESETGTDLAKIVAPALGAAITVTLPAATGTLATLAGSEALSNKTYAGSTATLSSLTSGRVVIAGASGLLTDDADLTFSGTTLTVPNVSGTGQLALQSNGSSTTSLFITDTSDTVDFIDTTLNTVVSMRGNSASSPTGIQITGGSLSLGEISAHPTAPSSGVNARMYVKADNLTFQWNEGGTTRYLYIPLTGTGTSWTHDTTGP